MQDYHPVGSWQLIGGATPEHVKRSRLAPEPPSLLQASSLDADGVIEAGSFASEPDLHADLADFSRRDDSRVRNEDADTELKSEQERTRKHSCDIPAMADSSTTHYSEDANGLCSVDLRRPSFDVRLSGSALPDPVEHFPQPVVVATSEAPVSGPSDSKISGKKAERGQPGKDAAVSPSSLPCDCQLTAGELCARRATRLAQVQEHFMEMYRRHIGASAGAGGSQASSPSGKDARSAPISSSADAESSRPLRVNAAARSATDGLDGSTGSAELCAVPAASAAATDSVTGADRPRSSGLLSWFGGYA